MPGVSQPSRLARLGGALGLAAVALLVRAYRLYHRTLRLYAVLPDGTVIRGYADYPRTREIIALCERDAVALGGFVANEGAITLVAPGRDGDWATAALEALGFQVVRGASERGGVRAVRQLVHRLQGTSAPAAVVVDGPLGPAGEAKPGVLLCALHTDRPVRPLSAAARFSLVFGKAWSRLYVPMPFSRLAVSIGEHVTVAADGPGAREAARRLLTERLAQARRQALDVVRAG